MRRSARVTLGLTEIRAEVFPGRRRAELRVALVDPDVVVSLAQVAKSLAERGVRRVALVLGHGRVQVRRVQTMPAVSRSTLRAILAQQPLRYFRPVAGQLVTDAAWLAPAGDGRSLALLAGADAELVSSYTRALQVEGVVVDRVVPDGYESAGLDLLPGTERDRRQRREVRQAIRLGLAIALVWIGFGSWKLWRLGDERGRLSRRLTVLAPAAQAVAAARREVEHAELVVSTLDSVSTGRGGTLATLADLAAGLPQDAYLSSAVLERDSVQVAGLAYSPVAVVERIALRSAFERPRMLEPRARAGLDSGGRTPFELVARKRRAG